MNPSAADPAVSPDSTAAERALRRLRRWNRGIALAVGLIFLGCAALVLTDIALRRFATSLGGTDEIAGYVMAVATAWGMAYGLLELAHVRIDFLRSLAATRMRLLLDLLSLATLSVCVSVIAWRCWPVVATSLKNSSRANTSLETPLAWVQLPWLAGWLWFAAMAWATAGLAAWLVWRGQFRKAEEIVGVTSRRESS